MPLNETISSGVDAGVNAIMSQPVPWWLKLLALLGGVVVISTLLKGTFNLIQAGTYVYAFFKWLFRKDADNVGYQHVRGEK